MIEPSTGKTYQIYTDGSSGKDRSGGWAFCVVDNDQVLIRLAGHASNTTNNRMELTAVTEGLKRVTPPGKHMIEVISDSAYVINCFKDEWYIKWRASNWMRSDCSGPVLNKDLWEALLFQVERIGLQNIIWTHVKGHKGNRWNEECDMLAGNARKNSLITA